MPPPPLASIDDTECILVYAGRFLGGSFVVTSAALLRLLLRRVGGLSHVRERCAKTSNVVAQQICEGEHAS